MDDIRVKPRVRSHSELETPKDPPRQIKKGRGRRKLAVIISVLAVILALGLGIGGWIYLTNNRSPVPKSLVRAVTFPIYYPNQRKLPKGYVLNTSSFTSPQKGIVIYSVSYGNKKLIFSTQKQPSDDDIQGFYANYIPLRNKMHTTLGQAEIGAYGSGGNLKTVVSLPTYKGTWLIITAPYDINQNQLKQVLNSLRK
jgi:hypothetical protein